MKAEMPFLFLQKKIITNKPVLKNLFLKAIKKQARKPYFFIYCNILFLFSR